MTRSDFDIEPFTFREGQRTWEAERGGGPARARATRARPRSRPPLGRRRPGAIRFIEPADCCACPAHRPELVTDGELYVFETLELESPASTPTGTSSGE